MKRPAPTRKPVRRFHHGALRAAAVELAEADIQDSGHQGLSLDRLADRLGVTRPALYHHFPNKAALLQEVTVVGYGRFERALDDAVAPITEPRAVLLAAARAYVVFADANPGWFRLQFSAVALANPAPHHTGNPVHLGRIIEALGALFGGDAHAVEQAYLGLWAAMHGVACFLVENILTHVATAQARRAQADATLDLVIDAIVALAGSRHTPPRPIKRASRSTRAARRRAGR